jgi:hypothetical protein
MKKWSALLLLVGLIFPMIAHTDYGSYGHLTRDDSVSRLVNHPAFHSFGALMLPRVEDADFYEMPLSDIRSLMPYHNNVDPDIVTKALNQMIDDAQDGKTIFYNFYTRLQKQEDPTKKHTGLFFFQGKLGAPFVIVCPGGGFSYVGSLHEGFPLAQ